MIYMVLLKGNVVLARKILSSKPNHSIKFWVLLHSQDTRCELSYEDTSKRVED